MHKYSYEFFWKWINHMCTVNFTYCLNCCDTKVNPKFDLLKRHTYDNIGTFRHIIGWSNHWLSESLFDQSLVDQIICWPIIGWQILVDLIIVWPIIGWPNHWLTQSLVDQSFFDSIIGWHIIGCPNHWMTNHWLTQSLGDPIIDVDLFKTEDFNYCVTSHRENADQYTGFVKLLIM